MTALRQRSTSIITVLLILIFTFLIKNTPELPVMSQLVQTGGVLLAQTRVAGQRLARQNILLQEVVHILLLAECQAAV